MDGDATPEDTEMEAALLGALMLDNSLVDGLSRLQPEHFYYSAHSDIFSAIRTFVSEGKLANPVTLRSHFDNHVALKSLGGSAYLATLTGSGAGLIGAADFAREIINLYELRVIRNLAYDAIERCEAIAIGDSASAIVGDLESALSEQLVQPAKRTSCTFAEAFGESTAEIEAVAAGSPPAGFTIARFTDWNAVCGRMEPGDCILLAGRPSMGKTAVGASVALGAAENDVGTDFLSLEMDRRKATRRMIAELIYDPDDPLAYQDLIDGRLKRKHWSAIASAKADIQNLPLTISDPAVMAIEGLAPHIRQRKREFEKRGQELKLVVVDYIGRFVTQKKLQSETEAVSYISRGLKAAAKECGVAIVALAQLSRAVETRENKRPMLADLRQSGSLEQDADTVIFVYREAYYLERAEPRRELTEKWNAWSEEIAAVRDDMELYSSKRREGALSKRISKFLTKYQAVLDHHDPRVTSAPGLFDDEL